jgi:hypothetical protein
MWEGIIGFLGLLAALWVVAFAPHWVRSGVVYFMIIAGIYALVSGADIGPYWRIRWKARRPKPKVSRKPRA